MLWDLMCICIDFVNHFFDKCNGGVNATQLFSSPQQVRLVTDWLMLYRSGSHMLCGTVQTVFSPHFLLFETNLTSWPEELRRYLELPRLVNLFKAPVRFREVEYFFLLFSLRKCLALAARVLFICPANRKKKKDIFVVVMILWRKRYTLEFTYFPTLSLIVIEFLGVPFSPHSCVLNQLGVLPASVVDQVRVFFLKFYFPHSLSVYQSLLRTVLSSCT